MNSLDLNKMINRCARVAGAILLNKEEAALVLGMSVRSFDRIKDRFRVVRTEAGARYRRRDLEKYANGL